jgi:hypothetical protein
MKWLRLLVLAVGVLSFICADAAVIQYTYDDAGRLVKADFGEKIISYTYDPAGNLLKRQIRMPVDPGDVNDDGEITLADAIAALKIQAGLADTVTVLADVNADQKIGLAEAVFVLRKAALP